MEKLNEAIDFIEFENNLSEMDDDQLDYLLHIYHGEKCYRKWRTAVAKELGQRVCEQEIVWLGEDDEQEES